MSKPRNFTNHKRISNHHTTNKAMAVNTRKFCEPLPRSTAEHLIKSLPKIRFEYDCAGRCKVYINDKLNGYIKSPNHGNI